MIQEAITDQLTGMVPDLIAVAAAFLVGIIIMRSFKQMAYAAEFDKQYKIAAGNAHKAGDKAFFNIDGKAWKQEYIANRSGGVKRQIQQKRQRAAFNYSRPGSSAFNAPAKTQKPNTNQKPKTNNIVRELKSFKQIKSKYGVSHKQLSRFQQHQKNSDEYFKNFESNFQKNNPQIKSRLSLRTGKFKNY
ncbi:hypothetical protein [Methylomonas rapida]|uniref:Uncharacterized protein n=1 Tax=Methylomonas rapida TaxID=2963939 RepID=A0ABY7GDD8_9GAMM|nr:hypothetical protein [Methylomonas rapida]WAR42992.1 hypothetical protein NM686_011310 [Methylomonas rapida]